MTTVSPTYAREITGHGERHGAGWPAAGHRSNVLSGILNGIDETVWNPASRSR